MKQMRSIQQIVDAIRASHFPIGDGGEALIHAFEEKWGLCLPEDMREFYLAINGAALFRPPREFPPIVILPLEEMQTPLAAIFGDSANETRLVYIDRGDGDFLAIELGNDKDIGKVIDCWHEAYPSAEYCGIVFNSFTESVDAALDGGGKSLFW